MWYVCDVLYAVLYVCVRCFVVCGCAVSRRYIYVFYCDMFSVVNVFAARMLGCDGDGNAGVGSGGCVFAVSAYVGGTRGSGVLASAGDVLEMSVVRAVGGVCDMCMCLARGGGGRCWG